MNSQVARASSRPSSLQYQEQNINFYRYSQPQSQNKQANASYEHQNQLNEISTQDLPFMSDIYPNLILSDKTFIYVDETVFDSAQIPIYGYSKI